MPRLADPDPEGLPELIRAEDAQAAGLTVDQVRQRVRSGRWQRMARGVYLVSSQDELDDMFSRARMEHVIRARAAAMTHAESVIALHSAAAVHALPTVSRLPNVVHLISPRGRAGVRGGVNIHRLPLDEGDVLHDGGPVTTPLRTWMDITRAGPLADSLAIGDAGLRIGSLRHPALVQAARACEGRGAGRIRVASELLDARRETPLESWSAACFHEWGLPLPEPQAVILDEVRHFVGRVDFLWEGFGVIGEADGALKYGDRRAHYDEKRREDRLRELGFRVIRWGWGDLAAPSPLRTRLTAALSVRSTERVARVGRV